MLLSSKIYLRASGYVLLSLLASISSYCAPPVGSHCNPSHLAGEDTAPSTMYPGYIFWPTPAEGKQSGRICVATFKTNHGSMSSLSVASATHCIQDLMLDQLVLGKDAKQPSPTIGIAISTKQDDACQSLDKAELASDIFDLPPLMTMKMPLSATAHPMARIDGASSSVLSPIWHNIYDHFWTTDRSESALADLRAKHQHLIHIFANSKARPSVIHQDMVSRSTILQDRKLTRSRTCRFITRCARVQMGIKRHRLNCWVLSPIKILSLLTEPASFILI